MNRARKGNGPSLIEIKTNRRRGHHLNDPASYRTKEEIIEAEKKCPIESTKRKIISLGILDEERIKKIFKKIGDEVKEAVRNLKDISSQDQFRDDLKDLIMRYGKNTIWAYKRR